MASPTRLAWSFDKNDHDEAARSLLYQDQQEAMSRRADHEEQLLGSRWQPLLAPKLSGGGFGVVSAKSTKGKKKGSQEAKRNKTKKNIIVEQQADILKRDGVLCINNVMSPQCADRLRDFVLEQKALAEHMSDTQDEQAFFGVEPKRQSRCDLQLSLLKGGFAADRGATRIAADDDDDDSRNEHPVADALQEVLGRDGTLRLLYEKLVTMDGEFYELASVITSRGSLRQQIHPDLPFRANAPLYVVFLALQDVTADMGPTTFLPGTHSADANRIFHAASTEQRDQQLQEAEVRLATLAKGSAVVFDARILHCGNANTSNTTRAMFNFSFRNPQERGNLGYSGSMRPGYVQCMTLQSVADALDAYRMEPNRDPFEKYGDGLLP